jgi:hypothetical protein
MSKKLAIAAELALLIAVLPNLRSALAQSPQTAPTPLSPEELQVYNKAHTVIRWSSKDIRARKELADLQPAVSQDDLPLILQQVGERVLAFIKNFPNTTAMESIQWELDSPSSKTPSTETFCYLLMRKPAGPWETLEEYRTDLQGKEIEYRKLKGGPLLTSGFSLALLYFAPNNQVACRYRYFGRQKLAEQETDVVGFAEIPEENLRLANYHDGPRVIPLLFQGLAWIDARSHEILRLQTDLLAPPPGAKLRRESTVIDYSPVLLAETPAPFLLPRRVIVDVWQKVDNWPGGNSRTSLHSRRGTVAEDTTGTEHNMLHCRNIHTYSDYKLFRVESRIKPTP